MPDAVLTDELVDERAWWKEHPEPQVTDAGDRLVLWNYPVGRTELSDVHAAAVRRFLQYLFLGPSQTSSTVSICGHASATGEAAVNVTLARERAERVADHLRGYGFDKLEVSSAGSSQPADTAPTGQALARNRRVEVTLYRSTFEPPPRLPVDPLPGPGPAPAPEASPGAALVFEGAFEIPLGVVETPTTEAVFTAVGKAKFKATKGDGALAAGLVLKDGKLSAQFQAKLGEHLKGKVGIDPGGKDKGPTAKVSLAGDVWGFPVEAGFQTKVNFVLVVVTLGTLKVPDIELDTMTLSLEIDIQVKVEIGPSKALLARLGVSAGAAGAVAVGVIGVTAVIIGGTIYAAESSKQKFADMVVDAAMRDGAASRVAYEALGATAEALGALRERRLELLRVGGPTSGDAFEAGQSAVGAYLDSLGAERDAKIKAWTGTHAANASYLDFNSIREKILQLLDPYQNDPQPLGPLIAAL